MNASTALRTQAEQLAARHRAQQVLANTNPDNQPFRIFQIQDERGRVTTHVNVSIVCPICQCDIQGEHIALIQFLAGRGLIFFTSQGHQLHYKGLALIQIDCGQPVTATVRAVPSPAA